MLYPTWGSEVGDMPLYMPAGLVHGHTLLLSGGETVNQKVAYGMENLIVQVYMINMPFVRSITAILLSRNPLSPSLPDHARLAPLTLPNLLRLQVASD